MELPNIEWLQWLYYFVSVVLLPFLVVNQSPVGVIRAIGWLKTRFNLVGSQVMALALGFSVLITLATEFVAGSFFDVGMFSDPALLFPYVVTLFGLNQFWYNKIKEDLNEDRLPETSES